MTEKISAVYKITNTITGDFYIGSSKNVKRRWADHKCPNSLKRCPNNQMYLDMKKYGIDKFEFQVIAEVEEGKLKEKEQYFIETLKPTYNNYYAKGLDIERYKESNKKAVNKYDSQLCFYRGETLTLNALRCRFKRKGIDHPNIEAKKYLIKKESKTPIEFYDVYP